MRQRLGLAVVRLADAPVLLLDEPGLSLDPSWRRYLKDRLRAHADAAGAVLMATHLTDVWADVVDVTLTCTDGTIEATEGSPPNPFHANGRAAERTTGARAPEAAPGKD
jgi:ABC-type multidrug transport system ATPase subunit